MRTIALFVLVATIASLLNVSSHCGASWPDGHQPVPVEELCDAEDPFGPEEHDVDDVIVFELYAYDKWSAQVPRPAIGDCRVVTEAQFLSQILLL